MATQGVSGLDGVTVALPDGTVVLRAMTLLAEPGEVLGVLGASGCGKSTILRAIAGLEKVREGRVLIDGEPAAGVGERAVSMVFQDSQLIPFFDAARNMAFPLRLSGTPREQARERVEQQATRFGLGRLLRRKPDQLSPGENARVSLGRATVREPKLFLFDEPFAHLDAAARVDLRNELSLVVRRTGVTAFLVTHDVGDVMSICDRVAVVADGVVLQIGTGRELYELPADVAVADLIAPGRITLLPARVVVSGGMVGYRVGERILPTWEAPPQGAGLAHDGEVLLGVRAEDVHEQARPEHGSLTGIVRTVELVGPYTAVAVEIGPYLLSARFGARSAVRRGDRVVVGVDAARALVFDASSRTRLVPAPGQPSGDAAQESPPMVP